MRIIKQLNQFSEEFVDQMVKSIMLESIHMERSKEEKKKMNGTK